MSYMAKAPVQSPEHMFCAFMQLDIQNSYRKGFPSTIRQTLKEAISNQLQDDERFLIFNNLVTEDYPQLAAAYWKVITFPACFHEIIERLGSTTGITAFYYVGDVFQQLCLISFNCRSFNAGGNILSICSEYENAVLNLVNDFIKKSDQKPTTFKTYSELQAWTFKFWPPGKVPTSIQSQKKKFRSPYKEEVDGMLFRFKKLNSVRQGQLVAALLQEIENVKMNSSGQLISNQVNIDFFSMKPTIFWWFYDIILEQCVQEFGPEGEKKINEQIRTKQAGPAYVNINEEDENNVITTVTGIPSEVIESVVKEQLNMIEGAEENQEGE
ncbi:Bromodomain_containing protein [Hexamita inflata]|uniref:Bromodomain containing protein n=1 Tax=Hexamita inflata TaxID=28002 RepID=A0AA86RMR8_9EUKA|nr:Bromodomain containing protein [Hexamita inflata]